MEGFLGAADAQAMAMANPRLAALLRPVLRMLGQDEPAWFPAPPTRVRAKRRAWTRPGQRARAAAENAEARPDTPTEEVARFVERARAHNEAVARQASFPGWIWINGRPAIPPPRKDNAPPPPPPASERWGGSHSWDGPAVPWWARGCR